MHNGSVKYPAVIVAGIVALATIAGSLTIALALGHGIDSNSTPLVSAVFAMLAPTIVGLLALLKAERVEKKTDAVNEKVNGHISRLTDAAINAGVKPEDLPPAPVDMPTVPGQSGGNGEHK